MLTEYSIVIPVYNSTISLEEIVNRICIVFEKQIKKSFEIIFVDDASPNIETWKTIINLTKRNNCIKAIQLRRNFGKPGAMLCGLQEAKGNYIITMDDDLQHLPEDIPILIKQKHHDIVIAKFKVKEHSIFKKLTSDLKGWFDYKLINKPKHIKNTPFRLFNRGVLESLLNIQSTYPMIAALIYYTSEDVINVETTHEVRKYGKSGYTMKRLLNQFSNLIISNSSFLLRKVSYIGILISIISFFYAAYILYRKIVIGISVEGWATITVVLLITSGLMLFSIGVIGEYLIRIINGVEKRPPYIIKQKINHEE